jgi:hypothetical protein
MDIGHRHRTRGLQVLLVIGGLVLVPACTGGDNEKATPKPSTTTTTSEGVVEEKVTGVPVKLPQRHVCRDVAPPPQPPGTRSVRIALVCLDFTYGDYVVPVTRYVPEAAEPFAAAFRELLRGPTAAEREAGLETNFAAEQTGDMLIEARIEGKRAVVNLDADIVSTPAMTNVATTSGGGGFIYPFFATAFLFEQVQEILPQFDGSTREFWDFLQADPASARKDWLLPTAPVPTNWEGPFGAAMYVGPALERFKGAPWFPEIKWVNPEGSGLGVMVTLETNPTSRQTAVEIGKAVARLLVDSGRFCDVPDVDIRNGADDRSNLAGVFQKPQRDRQAPCWSENGYDVRL